MATNFTKRLGGEYDLEPRESTFCLYTESTEPSRASTKKCGIELVLKGVMFMSGSLCCCTHSGCLFPRDPLVT